MSSTTGRQSQTEAFQEHLTGLSQEDRFDILLAAARNLHANGEETSGTLEAAKQLCDRLGLRATLIPAWGELFLQVDGDRVRVAEAAATDINMNRVAATLRAVEAICAGRLDGAGAMAALDAAGRAPASGLPLFAFACMAGAGALTLINGGSHFAVVAVVMFSAGMGALLRRGLAGLSAGSFLQMFAATLLAGGVGALALREHLSSPLRLVALGPLLVLIPGPVLMNGVFDIAAYRLPLGGARLGFGLLTILILSAGVLTGLALGGATMSAGLPTHQLPLWGDVLCAGITSASYAIFFSMPLRMLAYPVGMGMLAHAVRWEVISGLGMSNAAGAGAACLLVGVVLVPVAKRLRLPFAAVGFASVVSMVPGSFLIRMAGGLVQIQKASAGAPTSLIGGTLADGITALATMLAMALGLLLPMRVYRYFWSKGNKGAVSQ